MSVIIEFGILISLIAVATSALLFRRFGTLWLSFYLLIWLAILCILSAALWYLSRKEADRILVDKTIVTNRESNLTNIALYYTTEDSELNTLRDQHLGLIRYLSERRDIPRDSSPANS